MSSPDWVFTVATMWTRLTLTRMTGCSWASANAGARARRRLAHRRRIAVPLSFHPHFAIDEVLLLPDGNQFLEPVDSVERGFESRPSVRGGDNDRNTGLTDQHAAEPVHHGDARDGVRPGDLASDFGHHLESHRFVALVIEVQGRPALGIVADHAFKRHHGAVAARQDVGDHFAGI